MSANKTLRLDLTRHQRAALLSVLTDYLTKPDALEVSIDALTGEELAIGSLLTLLLDAEPILPYAGSYAEASAQLAAVGWTAETDPARIHARYRDWDLAEQVPRAIMYADMGVLLGTIAQLQKEHATWKQRAARGKSPRGSSRAR